MKDTARDTEIQLTKRTVAAASCPTGRDAIILRDAEVQGFGLRVLASGRKSYVIRYRTRAGRERLYTIGNAEHLSPEAARTEGRRLLGIVATGGDPSGDAQAAREAPTMDDLRAEHLAFTEKHRKPATLTMYRSIWNTHLTPRFGKRRVTDLTLREVSRLHADMEATPFAANMVIAVLNSAWAVGQKRGMIERGPIPWTEIEHYPEPRRKRRLTEEEFPKVWAALATFRTELTWFPVFVRAMLLTGCRLSEWRDARWDWVDLEAGLLRLPDSKTGAKDVALPPALVAELRDLPRVSAYVFPGVKLGQRATGVQWVWKRFAREAGIPDVHLHDLRRTAGSLALGAGMTMREVADILGHRDTRTTEIYVVGEKAKAAGNAARLAGEVARLVSGASITNGRAVSTK